MRIVVNKRRKLESASNIDYIYNKHMYFWVLENIYNHGMAKLQSQLKRIHNEQEKERQYLIAEKLKSLFEHHHGTTSGIDKGKETIIYFLYGNTLKFRFYQWRQEVEHNRERVSKKLTVNILKNLIKNSLKNDELSEIEFKLTKEDIMKIRKELIGDVSKVMY